MKTEKLLHLCKIRLGYSFRGSVQNDQNGNLSVIQPKNILSEKTETIKISKDKIKSNHLLNSGDILLTNRVYFKSKVFTDTTPSIANGGFFVLTISTDKILPGYLSVFLNSSLGQKALQSKQEIMTIPAISLKQLQEINIPIIPLSKQRKLSEFVFLQEQEYNLLQQLNTLKQQRLNAIIKGAINA